MAVLTGRTNVPSTGRLSLFLAAALHLALFLAIPAGETRRAIDVAPMLVIDVVLPGDIPAEIPEAPSRVPRPAVPSQAAAASVSEEPAPAEDAADRAIDDVELTLVDPASRRSAPAPPDARPAGSADRFEPSWEKAPVAVRIVRPDYPRLARQAGIEGTVVARAFLDAAGNVVRVEIIEAPSELFHEPVIRALLASRFEPARQGARAVPSHVLVPVEFVLND